MLSRIPSSVSFSVDAAGSGSSVSLFFLVDDHLAASPVRSSFLFLGCSVTVFFPTVRFVRESERWSNHHRHRNGDSWET